jgi:O-6-methylguanine DNA methyltransferase
MEGTGMKHLLLDLRELRMEAPASLAPAVLAEVGLADWYAPLDTALGEMFVAFGAEGITMVDRAGDSPAFVARYRDRTGRSVQQADVVPAALLRRPRFDLRGLTAFERDVLTATQKIPSGEVRPYSWVAREIGRPGAVRAVGSALGHNPIPLLIPCHRVVRTDGLIGNYSLGGNEAKRTILAAEGVDADELERMARHGTRYIGSDTTHIYCFPTCRHARRISDQHRVALRSAKAAESTGFRACKVCRPA